MHCSLTCMRDFVMTEVVALALLLYPKIKEPTMMAPVAALPGRESWAGRPHICAVCHCPETDWGCGPGMCAALQGDA
jgi:hypothetical protein